MQAYILIALEGGDENKIKEELQKHKEIIDVKIVFGEWDIIAKVEFESTEEMGTFIMEKIRHLKGIKMTSTLICAK